MARVTKHAQERMRSRLGIGKKSIDRTTEQVLTAGLTHAETTGGLHRYIDMLYLQQRSANNIRIWGEYIYLFRDDKLITVVQMPNKFKNTAAKLLRKKKNAVKNPEN